MSLFELLTDLGQRASAGLSVAFPATDRSPVGTIPAVLPLVRAGKPEFGDFQISSCLQLAKSLGKPPRELAKVVVESLTGHAALARIEIAGPGFVNLHLTDAWIAAATGALLDDARLGLRSIGGGEGGAHTIVVDYSSPNVAKPMHVGHIRSTIIGAGLDRVLRAVGYDVVTDNHIGDWGTQFGKLIVAYRRWVDEAAYARDAVAELERLYKKFQTEHEAQLAVIAAAQGLVIAAPTPESEGAAEDAAEDEAGDDEAQAGEQRKKLAAIVTPLLEEARRELVKLQAGDPANTALWRQFGVDSRHVFDEIYRRLDARFDYWLGESSYNDVLPFVVENLVASGVAAQSQGAIVVPLEGEAIPFLIRKGDGGFNYATTDLATMAARTGGDGCDKILGPGRRSSDAQVASLVERVGRAGARRVIIVTDERQQQHFRQLFSVARRLGVTADLEHVWFGLMRFWNEETQEWMAGQTRKGNVIHLKDLLDEAERRAYAVAAAKAEDAKDDARPLEESELREIARAVGIGAVKYNDLSKDRQTLISFTWDKALSLQGNTAPYLQYAYARIRSIVRKAAADGGVASLDRAALTLGSPVERDLAKRILAYPEAVETVARTLRPNALCDYLFELATALSGFYPDHPVLKAEPAVRASRLVLVELVSRVLGHGLSLLGIETLERM